MDSILLRIWQNHFKSLEPWPQTIWNTAISATRTTSQLHSLLPTHDEHMSRHRHAHRVSPYSLLPHRRLPTLSPAPKWPLLVFSPHVFSFAHCFLTIFFPFSLVLEVWKGMQLRKISEETVSWLRVGDPMNKTVPGQVPPKLAGFNFNLPLLSSPLQLLSSHSTQHFLSQPLSSHGPGEHGSLRGCSCKSSCFDWLSTPPDHLF